MRAASLGLGLSALLALAEPAAAAAASDVARIVASAGFRQATATLDAQHDRMVAETIMLTEIPAPPFKESARAAAYRDLFRAHGLEEVEIDAEGNVLGLRRGSQRGPLVVVSAHLDTVFPEGTPVKVRREGTKLFAPGVGDDSHNLAALLAWIRALDAARIRTRSDILFVGTVGEEGQGDLRGVRYLFGKGRYKDRVGAFFSFDGAGAANIVHVGVGSKRYRVTFKGPGGHSYRAFGIVNPMAAMGKAIADLYAITPPSSPRVTYAASVVGGGTSVNAIPHTAFAEFDMRSSDAGELARIESQFKAAVAGAVAAENAARSTRLGEVTAELASIGDRAAGSTPRASPLVANAEAAIRAFGLTPTYEDSSTDANVPMSLGIPAITLGAGGVADRSHSLDEWIDLAKPESLRGMGVGLATILATAGME